MEQIILLDCMMMMDINVEAKPVFIETPYYSKTVTVISDPPMPPEVEVIPYKGLNDRILLSLSPDSGQRDLEPIAIQDDEKLVHDALRFAQNREFKDANDVYLQPKLRFKSDDYPSGYEIYRMIKKPKSYDD